MKRNHPEIRVQYQKLNTTNWKQIHTAIFYYADSVEQAKMMLESNPNNKFISGEIITNTNGKRVKP